MRCLWVMSDRLEIIWSGMKGFFGCRSSDPPTDVSGRDAGLRGLAEGQAGTIQLCSARPPSTTTVVPVT